MKVDLKDLTETRKQLVVTLEASEVAEERSKVLADFVRHARLPGFRPGKAPVALVGKRFAKEIASEVNQAVVSRAYRDGIKDAGVAIAGVLEAKEPTILEGAPVEIGITVDIVPAFELPGYKGLPVKAGEIVVADTEVDEIVEHLRREAADFTTVDGPAGQGDYVKFGFEGRIGEQKIAELVPDRPIYGTMPQTWEEAGSGEGLLPGMGKHLLGLKKDDTREVEITFPADFVAPAVAGRVGTYSVTVLEVRQRILPAIDEAFFKRQNVASLEELRERITTSLRSRKEAQDRGDRRRQVAEGLAAKIEFPIPESLIEDETESLLRQMVEQNVRRGVPQDELEKNKEELFVSARKAAIERTKVRMLLKRVAEAEKLEVKPQDFSAAVIREAQRRGQAPDKLLKDLRKDRNQAHAISENVLIDKALDFLVEQATVSPA